MRSTLVICVAALVAATSTAGALAASDGGARTRPTLRLVNTAPLTIVGSHFRAGELVRIVVRGSQPTQRRARAARTGTFRVVLETWTMDRCGTPLVIQAIGARSGLAALKELPQPACPPPLGGTLP
jgi:hypothetical protein